LKGEKTVSGVENKENIVIHNAAVNNLKNISLSIPTNFFTCVTGVSGCGKSSLVYDTIFAESQREFLESMSGNMYGQKLMDKPQVDSIENLRPALNVSQSYYNFNPRSTVGTLTDISHYLRALFALTINFEQKKNYCENFFSANNPRSCCEKCKGLGEEYDISEDAVVPDWSKSLSKGAILYYKGKDTSMEHKLLVAICDEYSIDINKQMDKLSKKEIHNLLYRENPVDIHLSFKTPKGRYKQNDLRSKGAIVELREKLLDINTPSTFASISKYLIKKECSCCGGTRLKKEILDKKLCRKNIAEVEKMKLSHLVSWVEMIEKEYNSAPINRQVFQLSSQIKKRVHRIIDLKVGYISLDRSVLTLSSGEVQRIRIANQLNCSLKGLIYILDEPCKGLHIRNISSIIAATKELVSKDNTVIAIEHNKQYISCADKIIELGPEGGPKGGYLLSENKPAEDFEYIVDFKEESTFIKYITLVDVSFRNIQNQSVSFPIGGITCVTGVSGSGKSTLVSVIEQCFESKKNINCKQVNGLLEIRKILKVNQQPIGKTPRSTVVSYLEVYDNIRDLFAESKESKTLGLTASDFSMNVKGGRCECCQGTGLQKIELNYLPDSFVICPECKGKRFQEQVLSAKYREMNINEVLDAPIEKIILLFEDVECIYAKLKCMMDIGLGYIKLGQMSMNLSGGEAQRIKLAKALGAKSTGKNMYILDEPTSGLNSKDISKFCDVLNELRRKGETVIIIEHNIEFISKMSDYLIDFGIEAGDKGGKIVSQGYPKRVYLDKNSSWGHN
jgi:excinuclease ABC subunit A